MLNDNRFTVYFISSTVSKKTSGCRQMKEKNSCLKALAQLEPAEDYLNLGTWIQKKLNSMLVGRTRGKYLPKKHSSIKTLNRIFIDQ